MCDRFSVYLCLLVALLIPASFESNHQGIFQLDALAMQPQLNAHESCPTTLPPDPPFAPPLSYQQKLSDGAFWYGTEKLWTGLHVSGLWGGLRNDKGYREKVFWFRQGYIYRVDLSRPSR